jgi:hypothetical protein
MAAFLEMDETGVYVVGHGWARTTPKGAIDVPPGLKAAAFASAYIVDGKLQPRPMAPSPVAAEGGYILKGCPVGSQVIFADLTGGAEMAVVQIVEGEEDFSFSFPDEGRYRVEVEPPLPFMPSKAIIEVENAPAITKS